MAFRRVAKCQCDAPPGNRTVDGAAGWGRKVVAVALSEIDRNLFARCLARKPRAWDDFVDRFMGLVLHVIDHSAQSRGEC